MLVESKVLKVFLVRGSFYTNLSQDIGHSRDPESQFLKLFSSIVSSLEQSLDEGEKCASLQFYFALRARLAGNDSVFFSSVGCSGRHIIKIMDISLGRLSKNT